MRISPKIAEDSGFIEETLAEVPIASVREDGDNVSLPHILRKLLHCHECCTGRLPCEYSSLRGRRRHMLKASSSFTLYTMSINDVSIVLAMKSLPIPSI